MLLPGQRIYPIDPKHLWSTQYIKVISRFPSLYHPRKMMLLLDIEGFPQAITQWEEDFQSQPPRAN